MIQEMIMLIFIGIVSASASYFLDYMLGQPGHKDVNEINSNAVLFRWTLHLASNRLKGCDGVNYPDGFIQDYIIRGFKPQLDEGDCIIKKKANDQIQREIVYNGRELFHWEYATGMCIYCTNFWLSLIFISIPVYAFDLVPFLILPKFFVFITTPIFAHMILRKI